MSKFSSAINHGMQEINKPKREVVHSTLATSLTFCVLKRLGFTERENLREIFGKQFYDVDKFNLVTLKSTDLLDSLYKTKFPRAAYYASLRETHNNVIYI